MTKLKIVIGELNNEGSLDDPGYWLDFSISLNNKEINTTLQYDCGNSWCLNDGDYNIEEILEELGIKDGIADSKESKEYNKVEAQLEKAISDSEPEGASGNEIMEEFFCESFCQKDNGVMHCYYDDRHIQVYELSDLSIKVAVSEEFDPNALFVSFENYDDYFEFLHSDKIWSNASSPQDFSISHRVNEYIEKNCDSELSHNSY